MSHESPRAAFTTRRTSGRRPGAGVVAVVSGVETGCVGEGGAVVAGCVLAGMLDLVDEPPAEGDVPVRSTITSDVSTPIAHSPTTKTTHSRMVSGTAPRLFGLVYGGSSGTTPAPERPQRSFRYDARF